MAPTTRFGYHIGCRLHQARRRACRTTHWLYSLEIDSKGALYTGESRRGRVQEVSFKLSGTCPWTLSAPGGGGRACACGSIVVSFCALAASGQQRSSCVLGSARRPFEYWGRPPACLTQQ